MTEKQRAGMEKKLIRIREIFAQNKPETLPAFDDIHQSIQFSPPEVHIHVYRMCQLFEEALGDPKTAPDWARAIHDVWMSPNPAEGATP